MSELRFTVDHEWLRLESNGLVTVGITAVPSMQALKCRCWNR
jgi:glycine cleavage system H lipoate-binding protein